MVSQEVPGIDVSLPRQQLHWQNLSDGITLLELWSLFKANNLPGEGLDGKLQLILINSALSTIAAAHPPTPRHITGNCACVPGAACTQPARARIGKKDPVFQILGILCSDH